MNTISPDFAKALVKMQSEVEGAKKGKSNPQFKSKYADLAACWDACSDALRNSDVSILQFPTLAPTGFVGLITKVIFGPSGEILEEVFHMPVKDPNNPQAVGSALTYARRYALCSVVGICPEDDDGNKAAAPVQVQPQKLEELNKLQVQHVLDRLVGMSSEEAKNFYKDIRNESWNMPTKTEALRLIALHVKGPQG